MSDQPTRMQMSRLEFVALIAVMFATVAFSMDAMLPALPEIAAELAPDNPSRAPLILTAFFFGLGFGTFFAGPLSDTFGRKAVMIGGSLLYILAAALAWASASLELMLIARVLQGLGASGPRVAAMAVMRDLFSGREMARIVSYVMMVFALIPGVAPMMSVGIMALTGWRGIFVAFVAFATFAMVWMMIRLPETLPPSKRRALTLKSMWSAAGQTLGHPIVRLSITVQTLSMASLISMLMLIQQIFSDTYGRAESFPYWFGLTAIVAASASWLNSVLVVRLGMRRLVTWTLGIQLLLSGGILAFNLTELAEPFGFYVFLGWQIGLFYQVGLTLGNLNAISMEPLGHVAGMAASIIGGTSTVVAALIAAPIILFFDGSVAFLLTFILSLTAISFTLMMIMARVEARLEGASI